MNTAKMLALAILAMSITLVACRQSEMISHKLVVTGNQHSVPLYPDERTYLSTSRLKQEGGVQGMAGEVKQQFTAKDIDDQTPVKIVSSDDNGAVIVIIDGPMKGQSGFVPKQNID
jgi:hypothetical protein